MKQPFKKLLLGGGAALLAFTALTPFAQAGDGSINPANSDMD